MKIIEFQAENIKKLRCVDITPTGFNLITGANGSGKSSVIDALWWALAGGSAVQGKPVRDGAEKARVKLDLGEYIVERRFTAGGGTSISVETVEGEKVKSPQAVLNDIVGSLTFDPLDFSRLKPKEQFDILRRVAAVDLDLDALAAADKKDFDARTVVNRDALTIEKQIQGLPAIPNPPKEAVDTSKLMQELNDIQQHNTAVAKAQAEADTTAANIQKIKDKIEELNALLATYEKAQAAQKEIPAAQDEAAVKAKIASAADDNAKFAQVQRRAKLVEELKAKKKESEELTRAMDKRSEERNKALRDSKMPVEGITLGHGEVLYNGNPFDQAASGEQLRVSCAIAMAANPKLRIIRIKDGSLLDEDGLAILRDMAKERDFQVWCERVDTSGKVGIYMEDGEVKADNEHPA